MSFVRFSIAAVSLLLASACAATNAAPEPVAEPPEPELISRLPTSIESFDYEGYRFFEKADAGFTFRYTNKRKKRMADVYVYPVATENAELPHDELVLGSTRATLQAIGEATRRGIYANFNVVTAATKAQGIRTVARVETTYLRQNLASYGVLYQTEFDGTLMKIRVSMPDNESNRDSQEWDRFAQQTFDLIINRLQTAEAELAATSMDAEL